MGYRKNCRWCLPATFLKLENEIKNVAHIGDGCGEMRENRGVRSTLLPLCVHGLTVFLFSVHIFTPDSEHYSPARSTKLVSNNDSDRFVCVISVPLYVSPHMIPKMRHHRRSLAHSLSHPEGGQEGGGRGGRHRNPTDRAAAGRCGFLLLLLLFFYSFFFSLQPSPFPCALTLDERQPNLMPTFARNISPTYGMIP